MGVYTPPPPRIPPYICHFDRNRGDNTLSYAKKFLGKKLLFSGIYCKVFDMKKIVKLKESDMERLVKRVIKEELEGGNEMSLSQQMSKVGDYITDNGKQKPEGDYALIYRVLKAAYDQKFHPTILMEYLYKNLQKPSF